ncbi:MAG: fibronectin type III domain-containing protein, partial [Solirubrobacteraceae bacterium]|nr:fibronectin type III domain-containing protein [Patulibacter sp.]
MSPSASLRRSGRSVPRAARSRGRRLLAGAAIALAALTASTGTAAADLIDTVPPAQVTGVSATTFLDNINVPRVNIGWTATTDNVGVVGYDVYARSSSGNALVASVGGSVTSVGNLSVSPFPTTAFTVVAKDFIGNVSTPSDPAIANTCGLVQSTTYAPTGLVAADVSSTGATISWSPSGQGCSAVPATGYAVLDRVGGTSVQLATTGPSTFAARVTLTPGVLHVISVIPTGGGARLLESNPIPVQTPPVVCTPTPPSVRGPSSASASDITTTTA